MKQQLNRCGILVLLFMVIQLAVFSQTGKVWVTIFNPDHIPFFDSSRQLISKDSAFNDAIRTLSISNCIKALPASRRKALQRVYELSCDCSQIELESQLKDRVPVVSSIFPAPVFDTLHTPNDYSLSLGVNNYALNLINAQTAWDITKGDTNVVIAISDQNYNMNHSELVGKIVYPFNNNATTTHGTAVAISAAGNTNNNNGLASIGYDCRLGLYGMNYNEVLNAAYDGAKVINMSWTSSCFYNGYAQLVIDEAYDQGAFLVAAAGNGSTCGNPSNLVYPAAFQRVFAVTSIGPNDNHMRIPNDTTTTHQHNVMVDLAAPGYNVAINPGEGWYINSNGTSFAAPYVSGTIGLMLSANPCLSRLDIDTILRLSAVNIDSLNPLYIGKLGAGRLNAQAAVQLATNWASQPMTITQQPTSISIIPGGNAQFTAISSSSFPVCQWQYDSSGVFVDLVNDATYNGVNTPTLTISNAYLLLNNEAYRCVMSSGYCQAITNSAVLQVAVPNLPQDAGPIQANATVCLGEVTTLSIDTVQYATGYTWSITGAVGIVSGLNTPVLTITVNDTLVQVTVTPTNAVGSGASSSFTITGIPSPTASLSGANSICEGNTSTLTLNITGQGPFSGLLNGSIPFSGNSNPIQITVQPDSTTDYQITDLQGFGGCSAGSDGLGNSITITVLPYLRDTITATACTAQLPYVWQGNTYNVSGIYNDTMQNSVGCDSILTLMLNVVAGNVPNAPASIGQTLVVNVCNQRIYRYTASITNNAIGYKWTIPISCGGISGVVVDSGDINFSRVIRLKYFSNAGAFLTDSIKVRAYNVCGFGPLRAARLINTALNIPAAPASILVTPLVTNVCGGKRYRYTAPNLPNATASNTAATGWFWSFSTPTPLLAQLDSGTLTSKVIVVKYLSNVAAQLTDSIYLQYSSACGNSNKRALRINIAALNSPAAPASIIVQTIQASVCGNRRYRFIMPVTPNATNTAGAATGYDWTPTGNLALYGVVDSGSLQSRIVVMKLNYDGATMIGDSMKARYNSDCGLGAFRAVKFSVPKLSPPNAPASITITPIVTNICNARKYRYTAPNLPLGTTLFATPTGYLWSMPTGNLGSTGTLDSGTLNSQKIVIKYTSNAAATAGDSIRLRYTSSCGNGLIRAQRLSNLVLNGCPITSKSSAITSTNLNPKDLRVNVFPNPSRGEFNIRLEASNQQPVMIKVYDAAGSLVYSKSGLIGSIIQLGSRWASGLYIMQVQQGKQAQTLRLVKE